MRFLAVAALASATVLGSGCGAKTTAAPISTLRQPSSLAVFNGFVADRSPSDAAGKLRPYLVVANASRNDLTLLDASDDTPVESSILLRPLLVPVSNRPSLVAAASLGDGAADLLVAVSAGDSVLQVVETWTPANGVHSSPGETPARAVDLGTDVLALLALPPVPVPVTNPPTRATARIAAVLADSRIALVTWTRQGDGSIAQPTVVQGGPFPFQPLDLAVVPGDPQSELYAATLDPLPGGVLGVAAIPQSLDVAAVRALDARGPTRFVGALQLRERAGASTANDATAFDATPVTRVYAVLDPSGCGIDRRVDCGVVSLDPAPGVAGIPADWANRMPYRAPMRFPGRASAFAVSGPPSTPPAESADYAGTFMRLLDGTIARHTTGVAAVSTEDGNIYFFDLGRFESATVGSPVAGRTPGTPASTPLALPENKNAFSRLWVVNPNGAFSASAAEAQTAITITPGWTGSPEAFLVQWQGFLPNLTNRTGEAGLTGADLWVAMQSGEGAPADGRAVTSVVKLFHPSLGVHPNDVVAVKAAGITAQAVLDEGTPQERKVSCAGTAPKETTPANNPANEFEMLVGDLLPPSGAHPGGALRVTPLVAGVPVSDTEAADRWAVCFDALRRQAAAGGATHLDVSVRASDVLLTGSTLGYAGRPALGARYNLEYPADPAQREDALAALCPIADWDGSFPSSVDFTCGGTGCPRDAASACERLVLARKSRRTQNLSWECSDVPATGATTSCQALFNTDPAGSPITFPEMNGPVIGFEVDVQPCATGAVSSCTQTAVPSPRPSLARGGVVSLSVSGGVAPLKSAPVTGMNVSTGAITFDRSPFAVEAGYRFLFSYPSDIVVDVTPSLQNTSSFVIR